MSPRTDIQKNPDLLQSIYAQNIRLLRKLGSLTGLGFSKVTPVSKLSRSQLKYQQVLVAGAPKEFPDDPDACEFLRTQTYIHAQDGIVHTRDVYLAELAGAFLDLRTGLVCTSSGDIILESGVDTYRIKASSFYGRLRYASEIHTKGSFSSVWGMYTHNHGHWLIECLPRLCSLQHIVDRPIQLLMPQGMSPLQLETLQACLPKHVSVQFVNRKSVVRVSDYIFPSFATSGTGFFLLPRQYVDFVRDALFNKYTIVGPRRRKHKIFISRQNAQYRRILNEPEVIDFLASYGFVTYRLEELSFAEQVKLFYNADIVVSPHNAGLANTIFAEGARVLEIFSQAPEPTFFLTAKSAGNKYFFMFGDPTLATPFPTWPAERQQLREAINTDFHVDIAHLKRNLERLLDWRA